MPGPWKRLDLLVAALPVAVVADVLGWPATVVFVVGAVAVVPLAGLIGRATESLAQAVGGAVGALLNATFGTFAELAIAALLVIKGEVAIVKASVVGSMVGNLLLLLGVAILVSSYDRIRMAYNRTSRVQSTMLFLVIGIFLLPTVFSSRDEGTTTRVGEVSDAVALILVIVYGLALVFMLRTHRSVFRGEEQPPAARAVAARGTGAQPAGAKGADPKTADPKTADPKTADRGAADANSADGQADEGGKGQESAEHEGWSTRGALVVLAVATVLVAIGAEIVAGSVEDAGKSLGLGAGFLGFVILPLVGNAAEQFSALALAAKDRLDVAADIAIGASMQLVMLVVPVLVLVGLLSGHPFTLVFDPFELTVLVVGVLLIHQLVDDREANWFEGVMLLALYLAFAVSAYFVQI